MKLRGANYLLIFIASSFLGAGLLFLCQPMIAKLLLPVFGGSAAVWNASVLFFQVTLLAGYAYAHWSLKRFGLYRQVLIHAVLLLIPLLFLPFALPGWVDSSATSQAPIAYTLLLLAVIVGLPFFVLATLGPLLQYWFASTSHKRASQPYFLYAAGNVGSFAGLLAYPFLLEPTIALETQALVWAAGYGALVALILACAFVVYRYRGKLLQPKKTKTELKTTWKQRGIWLFLAFLPSSLMLGLTTYITTDIASTPLFWIIPLAIYLLTMVVAFGLTNPGRMATALMPPTAGLLALTILGFLPIVIPSGLKIIIYTALFACLALLAHGRLAASKPKPALLTEFFLWVAAGGALGGVLNGLVAPALFNNVYEFQLALLLSAVLFIGAFRWRQQITPRRMVAVLISILLFVAIFASTNLPVLATSELVAATAAAALLVTGYLTQRYRPAWFMIFIIPLLAAPIAELALRPSQLTERTFYGVITIQEGDERRKLYHGTTLHGEQLLDPERSQELISYYHPKGPFGDAFEACRTLTDCQKMAVIGLGTGTLAAYGTEGSTMDFYEIDPAMARIASNPDYFTYLQDSPAKTNIIIGDGRLKLEDKKTKYDILLMDAFSSDAIPLHLLTREAVKSYLERLSENGLLVFHISNRNVDLEPIVAALAEDQNLSALTRYGKGLPKESIPASHLVVLSKDSETLAPLRKLDTWQELEPSNKRVWTDSYSNILDAME